VPSGGGANFGGGWSQFATPGTPQYALQQLLQQGITGQAAIDILNRNPATAGIAYYPDSGDYGLPNGFYVAPNGSNGQLDLIQRGGGSGTGGAGGIGLGSLWNNVPTEQQAENMPGIQFAMNEANRALQAGAAAKGTLLNARTQQGIGESLIGSALSQGYIPLSQLQLGYNQANVGNLQGLAGLGLNATSVGQ
jgi:hypothetical protein